MKKLPLYVSLLVASAWTTPSEAQFFRRPRAATPPAATVNAPSAPAPATVSAGPAQRIAELIGAAQTETDERKRVQAVGALRNFDGNNHPEVPAVLADLARSDKSAAVRQEAVESLAAVRPTSQLGGQTLEWSAANDPSWRVRWEARTALLRYNLAGYSKSAPQAGPAVAPSTLEPPLLAGPVGNGLSGPPRGYNAPPSRPPSVQLPPRVDAPPSRGMTEVPAGPTPSAASPGGFLGRIFSGRKTAPPAPSTAPPAFNVPTFSAPGSAPANQPLPPGPTSAPPPLLETPPPLVIEVPTGAKAPAAPLPNFAPGKTNSVKGEVTEPVFRPAGQPAPRPGPGFSTAEPQRRNNVPPATVDDIPLLIPPM